MRDVFINRIACPSEAQLFFEIVDAVTRARVKQERLRNPHVPVSASDENSQLWTLNDHADGRGVVLPGKVCHDDSHGVHLQHDCTRRSIATRTKVLNARTSDALSTYGGSLKYLGSTETDSAPIELHQSYTSWFELT